MRAGVAWGAQIAVATIVIGLVASLALLGWVGWWALTTSLTTPHYPLPGVIGFLSIILWLGGCLTVIQHSWLAGLLFLAAGALVVSAWAVVPQPALLVAVSIGLAVGALLSWLADDGRRWLRWLTAAGGRRGALAAGRLVRHLQRRVGSWQIDSPRRTCLICQLDEATADGFCVDCGRWARAHPEEWTDARIGAPRVATTGRDAGLPARRRPEGTRPPSVTLPPRPILDGGGQDIAESGGSTTT